MWPLVVIAILLAVLLVLAVRKAGVERLEAGEEPHYPDWHPRIVKDEPQAEAKTIRTLPALLADARREEDAA